MLAYKPRQIGEAPSALAGEANVIQKGKDRAVKLLINFSFVVLILFAARTGACVEVPPAQSKGEILLEVIPCSDTITVGQEFYFELKVTNGTSAPVRLLREIGSIVIPTAIDPGGELLVPNCLYGVFLCDELPIDRTVILEPGAFYGQRLSGGGFANRPGIYQFYVNMYIQGCPTWNQAEDTRLKSEIVAVIVTE